MFAKTLSLAALLLLVPSAAAAPAKRDVYVDVLGVALNLHNAITGPLLQTTPVGQGSSDSDLLAAVLDVAVPLQIAGQELLVINVTRTVGLRRSASTADIAAQYAATINDIAQTLAPLADKTILGSAFGLIDVNLSSDLTISNTLIPGLTADITPLLSGDVLDSLTAIGLEFTAAGFRVPHSSINNLVKSKVTQA